MTIPRSVRTVLLALALLTLALAARAAAQSTPPRDPDLQAPYRAWEAGDYPEAMRGYLRVLDGPRGAELKDPIARLSGELHPVLEVARDGSRLRMSADGRHATFQATEDGAVVTHVVSLPDGRVVASFPGRDAAPLGGGSIAYRAEATDEIAALRREAVQTSDPVVRDRAATRERVLRLAGVARVRSLSDGSDRPLPTDGWTLLEFAAVDGGLIALGSPPNAGGAPLDVLVLKDGGVQALGSGGAVAEIVPVPGGRWAIGLRGAPRPEVLLLDRAGGPARRFPGRRAPAVSADGAVIAMIGAEGGESTLEVLRPELDAAPRVLLRTHDPLDRPALSPTGGLVAYQRRPGVDWEVFTLPTDPAAGTEELNVTREVQHDRMPLFLGAGTVLAVKGEARHFRSYLYDRVGSEPLRLFHNNTLRTIAPEYEWVATPDGQQLLIVAERDGDTVSPERGVYLVDRTRGIGLSQLRARIEENLGRELDLRARGSRAFLLISDSVRARVAEVSMERIAGYADELFALGSKHVARPGNAAAIELLAERLREFGYEPELQTFQALGEGTANVIARLEGTVDPELVYTVSSHFDSVEESPGADDNGSGTTALLEVARVLRAHPQPATIEFTFFSGEEEGLLGATEYVRRALADGKRVRGALNNDMIGWTENGRLDNTIRYSNAGIRDLQHAAAIGYTRLITYDALYYKNTDAHVLFDGFGDVVGGIGSHPVLGNPNYHQTTDALPTVNQRLVAEVSKTTLATVMMLASSPSRLAGLALRSLPPGDELELSWDASPEREVVAYVVRWTDRAGALREERIATGYVPPPQTELERLRAAFGGGGGAGAAGPRPTTRLSGVRPGSPISVKAVGARGLEGWDWASLLAPR